jgi:hypothetical protein
MTGYCVEGVFGGPVLVFLRDGTSSCYLSSVFSAVNIGVFLNLLPVFFFNDTVRTQSPRGETWNARSLKCELQYEWLRFDSCSLHD